MKTGSYLTRLIRPPVDRPVLVPPRALFAFTPSPERGLREVYVSPPKPAPIPGVAEKSPDKLGKPNRPLSVDTPPTPVAPQRVTQTPMAQTLAPQAAVPQTPIAQRQSNRPGKIRLGDPEQTARPAAPPAAARVAQPAVLQSKVQDPASPLQARSMEASHRVLAPPQHPLDKLQNPAAWPRREPSEVIDDSPAISAETPRRVERVEPKSLKTKEDNRAVEPVALRPQPPAPPMNLPRSQSQKASTRDVNGDIRIGNLEIRITPAPAPVAPAPVWVRSAAVTRSSGPPLARGFGSFGLVQG